MSIGDITPRDAWKTFPRMALYHETDQKAHQAATSPHNALPEPTPDQRESGEYTKGHVTIAGLPIAIENPQWSTRSGVDADGQEWSVTMRTHYGYLESTLGADGDEVDVILMPGTEPDFAGDVYVIEQIDPSTGEFDEHKVVLGAFDEDQAIEAYHANYDADWQGFGGIKSLDMAAFKEWLSQPPDGMMFDSLGQGIGAITDQDVQDDPLGVLDTCLGVLEARQNDQNIKYLSNKILADQNLVQQARVNNKDSLADYWLGTKSPIFDIILNDIDSLDADFVNRIFNDASFKKSFINKLIDYITPILPSADDVHLLQDAKPIKDSPSIQADGLLPFPWDEVNQGFYHSTRNSEATTNGFNQRYIDTVRGAMEKARPHVETVEQQVAFDQANSELQAQFISKIKRLAASRSGVYSGFMAGGSKLNTRQVERRGNSFDKTAIEIEKWMSNTAPDFIYGAVRSAMNNEQRQRERQQQQDSADAVVDQAAMDLWGLLTSTLPTKFAGNEVKGIGFSRDGLPSSLTIGGGWDPIKFTSLYKNKPYSVETLVNRLKAKGFDVPTKASQIKKSRSQTGTKNTTFNPDYKTITMDEWKRKSSDYKSIKDGQRYIFGMTESGAAGLIPVNVVKSLAAFDSIGSELQGITDQDIQDDPLAVLDLCLGVLDVQSSAIMPTGRENTVKTAKGTKIGTKFMVIEADQLITSHDASGKENPLFPQELQPRDRSREASQTWVQKVAANLDPDSLGRTGRADSGAPIIGSDRVVESGNGRSMAIKLAYERGTAEEYRQFIIDDAEYFGLDPDAIEAMNQPVLVRVRTTDIDRRVFTVEANQDDKLTFSATERARSDAKRLDDNLIGLFAPGEDGDLLTSGNQRFIQGFLKSLGDTESAQYMTTDGKPTKALVDRIKAAVFSKAYNDDRLLEMMADETKPEIQNVLNALGAAAPRFIEAQAYGRMATESVAEQVVDSIEQSLDQRVVDAVVNATNVLLASRAVGQDITEYVRQQGLFEDIDEGVAALAVFLAKNGRSAKRMGIAFKAMADFVKNDALDQTNNGLFGEPMPPSMVDVVAAANHRLVSVYGDEQNNNIGLFDDLCFDSIGVNLDSSDEAERLGFLANELMNLVGSANEKTNQKLTIYQLTPEQSELVALSTGFKGVNSFINVTSSTVQHIKNHHPEVGEKEWLDLIQMVRHFDGVFLCRKNPKGGRRIAFVRFLKNGQAKLWAVNAFAGGKKNPSQMNLVTHYQNDAVKLLRKALDTAEDKNAVLTLGAMVGLNLLKD
jgi:hypothetical protein